MLTLLSKVQTWGGLREETGATMVEYALLVVLIAIVALVAVSFAGEQVSNTFSEIGDELANP
ncbi:MAG: Flp family type IVb pilin [Acidimicrobiia bacterium]